MPTVPPGYHYDARGLLQADTGAQLGGGLRQGTRAAIDLQRAAFPEGQPEGYQLNRMGDVEKQKSPLLPMALTLAAPLGAAFGPGLFGALGGGGGIPGASAAPSIAELGLGAAPGAAGGGGVSGLLGSLGGYKGLLGMGGKALGAFAQGQATNRDAQFSGQLDLEHLLMQRDALQQSQQIAREQEGRTGGTDAWRKLLAGQYAQGRGATPHLSPYSVAPRDLSGLQGGSDALMREAMARLQGGNPIPQVTMRQPAIDPSLLQAGAGERAAGIGSAALSPILALLMGKK